VEGQLTIHLEAATGEWYPEENDGPPLRVAAFREEGGSLFTPGPLIRVVEGTEIHATISNRLDQPLTIHGLHSRPGSGKDVLIVCSRRTPRGKFSRRSPWNIFLLG
jgi:FtsP/CotA-like multicopper oxidase with cupredoxin domain